MRAEACITARIRAAGPWRTFAVLAAACAAAPLDAQDLPAMVGHAFADVGDVRLEYFRFAGPGRSVIVLQDHHDYFHDTEGPDAYDPEWVAFLRDLGATYDVVAPVRRGWGESDDPGYGYDVPSQAEDVLGLMDALGIRRAVLVGRTAATQEMTWIAEHHPERVAALAYLGTPLGHVRGDADPEVARFVQMYSRTACDIGMGAKVDARLTPRAAWRPHFARDGERRIDLPALLVLHPVSDRVSMNTRRIDRVQAWEPDDFGDPDGWCDDEAKAYFDELHRDPARLDALRRTFAERNGLARTQEAIARVFGGQLTIVWEKPAPDDTLQGLLAILRQFVDGLEPVGLRGGEGSVQGPKAW